MIRFEGLLNDRPVFRCNGARQRVVPRMRTCGETAAPEAALVELTPLARPAQSLKSSTAA